MEKLDDVEEGDLQRSQSFCFDNENPGEADNAQKSEDEDPLNKALTMPENWGKHNNVGAHYSNDSDGTPMRRHETFTNTPIIRGGPVSGVSHAKPKFCKITIENLQSPNSDEDDVK